MFLFCENINSCRKPASTGCHRSVAFGTPYQTKPPIEDTASLKLSVTCAERLLQNKTSICSLRCCLQSFICPTYRKLCICPSVFLEMNIPIFMPCFPFIIRNSQIFPSEYYSYKKEDLYFLGDRKITISILLTFSKPVLFARSH